jgi:hypothetical protein
MKELTYRFKFIYWYNVILAKNKTETIDISNQFIDDQLNLFSEDNKLSDDDKASTTLTVSSAPKSSIQKPIYKITNGYNYSLSNKGYLLEYAC